MVIPRSLRMFRSLRKSLKEVVISMAPSFPFLIDGNAMPVSSALELALSFAQAMQKRDEAGIPLLRRATETPTEMTRIAWPLFVRRAFTTERYFFSDLLGILGEKITLSVQPDFSLEEDYLQLREDDSFNGDALNLAERYASLTAFSFDSHIVTLFSSLGDLLSIEKPYPVPGDWGLSLPVDQAQMQRVIEEQNRMLSWLPQVNTEQDKADLLLKTLREVGTRRIEYYEWQKNKALQLLNEEIQTLEPQVNQQLSDVRQQQSFLVQQKEALQSKFTELEKEIADLQAEAKRYTGFSSQMQGFFNDRIRRTRDEMRYLSEQQAKNEEIAMEEMSARSLLVRRPLAILEQQRQQAERQWQQRILAERELIKTLTNILQDSKLSFQKAAQELLTRSQQIQGDYPEENLIELPFIVVRMQSANASRYLVLPPATMRPAGQISSFLTDLVRGIRLPLFSRGATWDEMAKLIEDRLNRQQLPPWIYEILHEHDLLRSPQSMTALAKGINALQASGLLTSRMLEQLTSQAEEVFGIRYRSQANEENYPHPEEVQRAVEADTLASVGDGGTDEAEDATPEEACDPPKPQE